MLKVKETLTVERVSLPDNHYIVRWLRPLLHQQLGQQDVFVPDHVTEAMLVPPPSRSRSDGSASRVGGADGETSTPPRIAFYFTVPSEHWSVLCVRGSAMSEAEVRAQFASLEKQEQRVTTDEGQKSVALAFRKLNRQVKRGLVPEVERLAQRHAFHDDSSVREAWGKFRVYRSQPADIDVLAGLFEQSGYTVIPILPAFSWRDVEFPHEDERYRVPMVHAQSRAPCPWSKRSLARRLYVHR